MKKESITLSGRARLTVIDPKTGKVVKVIKSKNLITTVGRRFVADMLIDRDGAHDTGLTFCAIGTNAALPAITNTQLGTEVRRKPVTTRIRGETHGITEVQIETYFTAAESAFAIEEAGIFGHASATAAANSGILLSRWLIRYDNRPGNFALTFSYVLQIR